MPGITKCFTDIFHNKFLKQNNDMDIIIPIAQMEKLKVSTSYNITRDIKTVSCRASIHTEVFKIPSPTCLHIIYKNKTRVG